MEVNPNKALTRSIFIESLVGNIKEKYFFEKKLGSGGYGAVYLAKNKQTGKCPQHLNPECYRRESGDQGHAEEQDYRLRGLPE
jgi:serine/threonine protein kinase